MAVKNVKILLTETVVHQYHVRQGDWSYIMGAQVPSWTLLIQIFSKLVTRRYSCNVSLKRDCIIDYMHIVSLNRPN